MKPFELSLYLIELLESANSVAPIEAAVYGIRWAHSLAAIPSPTDHGVVKAAADGCKRLLAKPKNPKDPVPVDIFVKLVSTLGGSDADLHNLRFLVLCLVGFAGFMRISELLKIKMKDVKIFDIHMSITLPKRKNDSSEKAMLLV